MPRQSVFNMKLSKVYPLLVAKAERERRVNQYVTEGRIPGVERFGRSWAIPENAEKPTDPRKEKGKNE